jgi:hypothetical protein
MGVDLMKRYRSGNLSYSLPFREISGKLEEVKQFPRKEKEVVKQGKYVFFLFFQGRR